MEGLQELGRRLQESRCGLRTTVEAVPAGAWFRRPQDGGWSPIEVLEHIALVEKSIVRVVNALVRQGVADPTCRRSADAPPRIWEALPLRPLAGRKLQAPQEALPRGGRSIEEVLASLSRSRLRLEGLLPRMGPLDTDRLVMWHPLGPELNVCQWVNLAASHEVRHTRQLVRAAEG